MNQGRRTHVGYRAWALLASWLLAVACLAGCSAQAEVGRFSLTLISQGQHVIPDGDSLAGDLVVIGGSVTLASGAQHRGSVIVFAGQAHLEGTVSGDVLALSGLTTLAETAVVTGDVRMAGGAVDLAPGAVVKGRVLEEPAAAVLGFPRMGSPAQQVIVAVVGVALAAAVAAGVTRLAPRPVNRVSAAAAGHPVVSGALGTLVMLMVLPLSAALIFTVVLIPGAGVVVALLGLMLAFGGIGLGLALGRLLARRARREWSPPTEAAIGTALLAAAMQIVALVPILGAVVVAVTSVVTAGAVAITGFGTRPYVPPDDDSGRDATRRVRSWT